MSTAETVLVPALAGDGSCVNPNTVLANDGSNRCSSGRMVKRQSSLSLNTYGSKLSWQLERRF
jgi:hypothetical protein